MERHYQQSPRIAEELAAALQETCKGRQTARYKRGNLKAS